MEIFDISYELLEDLPELPPNISQLDCSHNKIKSSFNISHLLTLQSLDFSHNLLTQIQGWSFLSNLSILNLSNNHLSSIQGLSQCYKLTSITLQFNKLRSLTGLESLKSLQYLNISHNMISDKMHLRTLSLNNKLEVLYLEGNVVKNYRQFCYSVILSLTMLDGTPTPGFTRKGSVKDSYKLKKVSEKYNC